ncbi:MAG TPA: DUF5686 family protein [Chitinophagaceae bacterium]|nr:DUF5686 family protein [Chitinophagaceae bacterium]
MDLVRNLRRIPVIICLLFIGINFSFSQTVVKGFVRDASTLKRLPFVSIFFESGKGVISGEDGSYSISTQKTNLTTLEFSYVGYKKVAIKVIPNQEQTINVDMEPEGKLAEVVVRGKRGKYRNKNNPAVELIDLVIANKEKNRITSYDYVQYQQYEKLALSLANKPERLIKNRLFRNYKFVLENVDTSTVEGKSLLPIYITEKLSERYLRKNPEKDKTIVLGEKKVNYGDFLDNNGINQYLNRLYADINIYDNNINILNVQFLSPIADMGPTFYRYYLRDTVEIDGIKLVQLFFTPKNPNDLIFRGTMYITLDGKYGVQKISMTISKNANLNWTRGLQIKQDFEKAEDGRYHVIKSVMLAEFVLSKGASGGVFGERTVSFKNFIVNKPAPDSVYSNKDINLGANPVANTDSFWLANRHTPLSTVEAKAYYNIDSLRKIKSFKRLGDIFTFIFSGYVNLNKYELGNTNTFYSFNPVEGFKLRVGGRTTERFSRTLYFDHYAAYGFKDQKVKYLVGATYSFNHKSIYSFPLNYLRVSYQYDTKIPGQELLFSQEDNLFLSFKRGNNNKWLYNNFFKAEYVKEFGKNISYTLGFKNWKQSPAGDIIYEKVADNSLVKELTTSEVSAELRWAPNEQFYQGKNYRIPIINKYPVFKLRYIKGIKGLLSGQYNYQNITFRADKRFYLSQLGYADVTFEGGYIFGKLPFPLLTIHRANQTYAYQINSYNLMNFMEFVSDRFAASNIDFYFNGFFLNKLPVLKKLKLREVASFKILYGGLRDENNPVKSVEVFKLPSAVTGEQTTFSLDKRPYIEMSVGLANIFRLVRIDLVKRMSYLDHPDISKIGIRTKIRFDF